MGIGEAQNRGGVTEWDMELSVIRAKQHNSGSVVWYTAEWCAYSTTVQIHTLIIVTNLDYLRDFM